MGVKIRNIGKEDIETACKIQEKITKRKVPKYWRKKLSEHIEKNKNECLAAVSDEVVVGFIIGEIRRLEFGLEKSGWILIVGVEPKFMGRGVGRELGNKLLSHFRREGIDEVYTAVKWDWTDLLAFFKSIGFKRSDFINLEYRRKV